MVDTQQTRTSSNILPDLVVPGDTIRASDFNAILQALRDGTRIWAGAEEFGYTVKPQMIRGSNNSGGAIGKWQLVEIDQMILGQPPVLRFDVPSADGIELIAITAQPIAAGALGWCFTSGECYVEYAGAAPAAGDKVISQNAATTVIELPANTDARGCLTVVRGSLVVDGVNVCLVRFPSTQERYGQNINLMPIAIEARTGDPVGPDDGRIWVRTDL